MAVDVHNEAATREKVRVFMTGDCDGLADLRGALERHLEIDFVGASPSLGEAAAALRGGHLAVVLHGTRSSTLPEAELAAIREHTRAPIILLASGGSSVLLEEALEADVADVLLLPAAGRERRLRHSQGEPLGRAARGRAGPARPDRDRLLAQGRDGQDRHRDEPAASCAKFEGKRALLARPRPPVRRRRDHARHRAGEDDLRPGRRSGRARHREARGVRTRHACGLDILPAPLRPEDAELVTEAKLAPAPGGGARVVRRHRRRHVAVLPRADAGDARPHGRAPARLLARRADAEERAARAADARAALVPVGADPPRPEPRQLEGRDEARARSRARSR